MKARLLLALVVVGAASGCNAFRASIGLALGAGGSVKVGVLDAGCLGGADISVGTYYGEVGGSIAGDLGLPGIMRGELLFLHKDDGRFGITAPLLLPFYPAMAASDDEKTQEGVPFLFPRPFEVAVSAYAGIIAIHLGFDAGVLGRDIARFAALAAGRDDDDPPAPAAPNAALPSDGLLEAPYYQISADDLANLDSGTIVERTRQWAHFVSKVSKPDTLVAVDDEHYERWVEPRLGLELAGLDPGLRKKLAALRATQTKAAFDRVRESRDPCVIEEALALAPLADVEEQAELERRRGALLLERGEVEAATWAFEDALRHLADESEVEGARRRLATARALLEAAPPAPARQGERNAWAGSADMEGVFLGAAGTAVWCVTRDGTVVWENPNALPSEHSASRVIGVESGLALVEVQARTGRPWLFALDDGGRVVWRTPLPAPIATGSPADQFYVHGLGRVFVGRVDRVLALDAATGRVLWMTVRKDVSFQYELPKPIAPLDRRPPPPPPRRRPDGEGGFQLRLLPGRVEMSTSRGAPIFRFDPRTGEPLRRS